MFVQVRRVVASLLIVCTAGVGMPLPAQAAMVGTEIAVAGAERERLASFTERADVRAKLESYGVSASDVQARVASLTDTEAAQLAAQMDQLPAGGVVGAIVFVFLVLLITDILGLTKIFPFTRPIR
jgi:hypothetical protein